VAAPIGDPLDHVRKLYTRAQRAVIVRLFAGGPRGWDAPAEFFPAGERPPVYLDRAALDRIAQLGVYSVALQVLAEDGSILAREADYVLTEFGYPRPRRSVRERREALRNSPPTSDGFTAQADEEEAAREEADRAAEGRGA
jgi:hypothetical protein